MCRHRAELEREPGFWGAGGAPHYPLPGSCLSRIHLEAHERDLSGGYVNPTLGDGHTGDVVAMTVQEILFLGVNCLNQDRAAQRVNEMLLVRMAFQARGHVS